MQCKVSHVMILCVCDTLDAKTSIHSHLWLRKDLTRKQQEQLIVPAGSLAEANYEAAVHLSVIRDPRHIHEHPPSILAQP